MNPDEGYDNQVDTKAAVQYVPLKDAPPELYSALGFRCGLEIHQQLATEKKLFCRCPAGLYQQGDDFDAQLVRHMRPTLSELGEYDGTALMEHRTKKNITYRIKGLTACTYDIDDTPPFALNRDALDKAIEIALLLRTSVVGEIHIARKQYLDGSIPTGFQRTAIIGIDGDIELPHKSVRIRQLSIEEDSCREISDTGHERVYSTDRLGMPLVETVTDPVLLTPQEAAEAAHHLRYLVRSTGKVNVGLGAARQDVNVSITGGTRVEIKGVQHIRWIPVLTHNEAFRQKALLRIRQHLLERVPDPSDWSMTSHELDAEWLARLPKESEARLVVLPHFAGLLSHFTNPGRTFADEIADRLKVIACIEKPNLAHSGSHEPLFTPADWDALRASVGAEPHAALTVVWGPSRDIPTALETIDERCQWAFEGIPNETRKALADGTTLFERVLPGPDRMYPDTDSAPIPIHEDEIEAIRATLPRSIEEKRAKLNEWDVPNDARAYILRRNVFGLLEWMIESAELPPVFAASLLGHTIRHVAADGPVHADRVRSLIEETRTRGLQFDLLRPLLAAGLRAPKTPFDGILAEIGYQTHAEAALKTKLLALVDAAETPRHDPGKALDVVMGRLRPLALGNLPLSEVAARVKEALTR